MKNRTIPYAELIDADLAGSQKWSMYGETALSTSSYDQITIELYGYLYVGGDAMHFEILDEDKFTLFLLGRDNE